MSREIYIYWRLAADHVPAAAAAMSRWQADLVARHPGLQARLLQRASAGDEPTAPSTLMETYVRAEGIDAALQAAIESEGARAAARWCQGARHTEVFEPIAR